MYTGTFRRFATSMRENHPSQQEDGGDCKHVVFWRQDTQWPPVSSSHSEQPRVDEWMHSSKLRGTDPWLV